MESREDSRFLELDLQAVGRQLLWVLATELGSSATAVHHVLESQAISNSGETVVNDTIAH